MDKTKMAWTMLTGGELSFTKVSNFVANYISMRRGDLSPPGYPSVLMIEPTNYCNLRCPLCPTGNGSLTAPRGYMSLENFKKVIDECGKYLLDLTLWNYGEPFLNKDICEMIDYAKSKNIFIRISTNGHFLNNGDNIKRIVASGLDEFIVSLDGASQETFSKYRQQGNFDTVVANLNRLVDEKKRTNKNKPFIELQFIVMAHNEHEIPQIKELAKKIGVDALKIKSVNLELEVTGEKEKNKKFLPKGDKYSRYNKETLEKKDITNTCQRLWLSSVVNWDGSVVACCYDPNRVFEFGNCFEDGFMKVWHGEKYRQFRQSVLNNKAGILMCKECSGSIMEA